MIRKLLPAVLAATALTFAACGGSDSQEVSPAGDARGNPIDRGFVAEMVPHHESAVEMAKIAQRRGESAFVKKLADDIVRTQTEEVSVLRREDEGLDVAGVKRGRLPMPAHLKGMDDDPKMLESAEPFDRKFLEMMLPHHKAAVEMARVELQKGSDPELKLLAQDIIDAQEAEIAAMEKELAAQAS